MTEFQGNEQQWDDKVKDERWVQIQQKTFTRWANTYLKERMLKLDDLETGFADGVLLINLLEIISSKSIGKFNKNPKIRSQKLENNLFALNFLKSEGIKLVNIGNEDIVDCKLKLILGLIWTIICRYQIHVEEGKSARSDLLKWVRKQIPEYNIMNFTNDWNDGRAICALVDSLKPGLCPTHRSLNPDDAYNNADLGTSIAERDLEIPRVLAPEDMISKDVDELSVMTYISYFRDWEQNQAKKRSAEELEKITVPARCKAYGPGLERGETHITTDFTIEAINANMRRVAHGGDSFEVVIKSPKGTIVTHTMNDNNNGTYHVHYTPTDAGKHLVSITLTGQPISNSPYQVQVFRSGPDATKCYAHGPGIENGTAFQDTHFTIQSVNRVGEPIKEGGDKYDVLIQGPYDTNIQPEIVDKKDGTYFVKYTPMDEGEHLVHVTLNSQPISGSPYHVPISQSTEHADAMQCNAFGPGLQGGNTSEPATFTIEVRNVRGDLLPGGAPVDVEVTDSQGSEIATNIIDNRNGTYTCTYQALDPGTHNVDVVIRHELMPIYYRHIRDSPFKVPIVAGTDARHSIAYGPGLENNVNDHLPAKFTIQAKDRNGNNINKGGDSFQVKVSGPAGEVPADVKDNGDGTYDVVYNPTEPGKHRVDVNLKGSPINNSPWTVLVKEGADETTSTIESYSFVIQARTRKGANRKDGGDDFKISITTPSGTTNSATVQDAGNGQYIVTFKPEGAGTYNIKVTLNGIPLKAYENLKVVF